MSIARAHLRSSWRQQRPRAATTSLPARLADSFTTCITKLPNVQRFLQSSSKPFAKQLVAEATGGRRQLALRIFFEAMEFVLAEIMLPYNEAAPSVHQMSRAEILNMIEDKCATLCLLGQEPSLVVRREDSGFFSGFLVVLDVLLFAAPDAEVRVDWRCDGTEKHFGYGGWQAGEDVWSRLFEPVHRKAAGGAGAMVATTMEPICERWNLLLAPRFRWLSRGSATAAAHRGAYHEVYARHVRITHPRVRESIEGLGGRLRGCLSLGVHKRVWNPGTQEYQGCRSLPSCAGFVEATRRAVALLESRTGERVRLIYLASDDEAAPPLFEAAFGSRLVVRAGVTRAGGGLNADETLNELHVRSPHNVRYACGIREAADVVTDAHLLAMCSALVHIDSNVTSAVSFINPALEMLHVADLLAGGGDVTPRTTATPPPPPLAVQARAAVSLPPHFVQRGYLAGQRDPADYVAPAPAPTPTPAPAPARAPPSPSAQLGRVIEQAKLCERLLQPAHVQRAQAIARGQMKPLLDLLEGGEAGVDRALLLGLLAPVEGAPGVLRTAAEQAEAAYVRCVCLEYGQALSMVGKHAAACAVLCTLADSFVVADSDGPAGRRLAAAKVQMARGGEVARDGPLPATAGVFLREVYQHWAEAAARRDGALDGASVRAIHEQAARRGVWAHPLQRPLDHYKPSLRAQPFWDAAALPAARALEAAAPLILEELRSLLLASPAAFAHYDASGDGGGAHPAVVAAGEWTDVVLFSGCRAHQAHCARCPRTAALIASRPEFNSVIFGSHFFSRLTPGSHLSAHCGPSNFRLRCHLGLCVPAGVRIRVGSEVREWEEGECLVFDDSFEHEVWHEGDTDRIVLICDMWHPDLDVVVDVMPALKRADQHEAVAAARSGAPLPLHQR